MQSAAPVVIRPPAVLRAYVAGFLVLWISVVVWTTMIEHHGPSMVIGIVFIAVGLTLGFRLIRLGVTEQPDGDLLVRNNLSSRTLSRTDVEEFRIATQDSRLGGNNVQALLADDTIYSIDVTRWPALLGRGRVARQLTDLESWLGTAK